MADDVRAFIALELPDAAKLVIAGAQAALRRGAAASWVRWVDPFSIHITLKFLGNVPTAQLPDIVAALERSAEGVPLFALVTCDLGVFPGAAAARILWLGLAGQIGVLGQLQARVEQRVAPLGFPPEHRPFTPHLTLGRVREGAPPDVLRSLGQLGQRVAGAGAGSDPGGRPEPDAEPASSNRRSLYGPR